MSELKLLSCPFCGTDNVGLCYDLKRNGDVQCHHCCASADVNVWNQRSQQDTEMLDWLEKHDGESCQCTSDEHDGQIQLLYCKDNGQGESVIVYAPTLRQAIKKAMDENNR